MSTKKNNPETTFSDVLINLEERDTKDSNRLDSPLKVAEGSEIIDTTHLEIYEQVKKKENSHQEIIKFQLNILIKNYLKVEKMSGVLIN